MARTISGGSLPGTQVVRNATRVPGSGVTGTGSRATRVAWVLDTTLTSRNTSTTAMIPIITLSPSSTRTSVSSTRSGQCSGSSSQTSRIASTSGAVTSSRPARIRCGSWRSRLRYWTRYGVAGSVPVGSRGLPGSGR